MPSLSGSGSKSQATSSTTAVTSAVTSRAGDAIVVSVQIPSTSTHVTGVSDTYGNSYHQVTRVTGTGISGEVWAASNVGPSTSSAVTVTISVATAGWAVVAGSYAGVASLDSIGTSVASSGTAISGVTLVAQNPGDLVLANLFLTTAETVSGLTSGYTDLPAASLLVHQGYALTAAQGKNTFGETLAGSSQNYVIVLTAFAPLWSSTALGGKPTLTISSVGLSSGLAANNGADFGPDTIMSGGSATTSNGIVEALAEASSLGGATVVFLPGTFSYPFSNGALTVPSNVTIYLDQAIIEVTGTPVSNSVFIILSSGSTIVGTGMLNANSVVNQLVYSASNLPSVVGTGAGILFKGIVTGGNYYGAFNFTGATNVHVENVQLSNCGMLLNGVVGAALKRITVTASTTTWESSNQSNPITIWSGNGPTSQIEIDDVMVNGGVDGSTSYLQCTAISVVASTYSINGVSIRGVKVASAKAADGIDILGATCNYVTISDCVFQSCDTGLLIAANFVTASNIVAQLCQGPGIQIGLSTQTYTVSDISVSNSFLTDCGQNGTSPDANIVIAANGSSYTTGRITFTDGTSDSSTSYPSYNVYFQGSGVSACLFNSIQMGASSGTIGGNPTNVTATFVNCLGYNPQALASPSSPPHNGTSPWSYTNVNPYYVQIFISGPSVYLIQLQRASGPTTTLSAMAVPVMLAPGDVVTVLFATVGGTTGMLAPTVEIVPQ